MVSRTEVSALAPTSLRGLFRGLRVGAATALLAGLLIGCGNGLTGPAPPSVTVELDFTTSTHGWEADFSDYPVGDEENMELEAGHRSLPPELGPERRGLFVGATNRSDDVFMFWAGRAVALAPDTRYRVTFEVEFATASPSGCVGIGGAPGESVHLKVGATRVRPEPVDDDGYYQMSIDKGNQLQSGENAIRIGDVANTNEDCLDPAWEMKTVASGEVFEVIADEGGAVWLLVGTDSGFEGRTELYYTRYRADFDPL